MSNINLVQSDSFALNPNEFEPNIKSESIEAQIDLNRHFNPN